MWKNRGEGLPKTALPFKMDLSAAGPAATSTVAPFHVNLYFHAKRKRGILYNGRSIHT